MMRNKEKNIIKALLFLMAIMAAGIGMGKVAEGKTKTDRMELKHKYTVKTVYYDYKNGVKDSIYLTSNVKKIKVKYSKKGYVKNVKITKIGNLKWLPVKAGKTTLTVKGYTKKGKYYGTWKIKMKVKSAKAQAKKAAKLQNKYRKKYGVSTLKWSETLYQLGKYRFETSGYDKHYNLQRDYLAFLGVSTSDLMVEYPEDGFNGMGVNENLCGGQDAMYAVKAWKKSTGHYDTMTRKAFKTAAIYISGEYGVIGIYSAYTEKELKTMLQEKKNKITVTLKRYDSASNSYQKGCTIYYYEAGNKWDTFHRQKIIDKAGAEIYLEVGKTYVFYEDKSKSPDGCEKAEKITVTITKDTKEIILKS